VAEARSERRGDLRAHWVCGKEMGMERNREEEEEAIHQTVESRWIDSAGTGQCKSWEERMKTWSQNVSQEWAHVLT